MQCAVRSAATRRAGREHQPSFTSLHTTLKYEYIFTDRISHLKRRHNVLFKMKYFSVTSTLRLLTRSFLRYSRSHRIVLNHILQLEYDVWRLATAHLNIRCAFFFCSSPPYDYFIIIILLIAVDVLVFPSMVKCVSHSIIIHIACYNKQV